MAKKSLLLLLFILIACTQTEEVETPATLFNIDAVSVPDGATLFVVDSTQSAVGYVAFENFLAQSETVLGRKRTTGEANTRGVTQDIEGVIVLNLIDGVAFESAEFGVNLLTLKTNRPERDAHIRSYNLESNIYPTATFTATDISGFPDKYQAGDEAMFVLNGNLQIRDVSMPVGMEITAVYENGTISGSGDIVLKMTDFGIEPPSILTAVKVADEFTLFVDLVAVAQN